MKDDIKIYLISMLSEYNNRTLSTYVYKIINDDDIEKIVPEKMFLLDSIRMSNLKADIKQAFVIGYLLKAKSFAYSDAIFEELFLEYQLLIEQELYVFRTIGYIPELKIDKEVVLGTCKVCPINNEHLEFFYDMEYKNRMSRDLGFANKNISNGTMILIENTAKTFGYNSEYLKEICNVLKSFILVNGVTKPFSITQIYTFSYFYNSGSILAKYNLINYSSKVLNLGYSNFENIEHIEEIFRIINTFNDSYIFMDRIVSAFSKSNSEDKYLDLMIALESLFPSIKSEISFKLSLYSAIVLKVNYTTYKKIKKLYDLRSNIVHGSVVKENSALRKQDLELLDIIVRKLIIHVIGQLNNGMKLEQIEMKILESLLPFENSIL